MVDDPQETVRGTLADIDASVARAVAMPHGGTFIAQLMSDDDLFVQFAINGRSVIFDFPLLTPRQRKHEQAIRSAAAALRLPLVKDGTELQIPFAGPVTDLARIVRELLTRVYDVTPATPLELQSF